MSEQSTEDFEEQTLETQGDPDGDGLMQPMNEGEPGDGTDPDPDPDPEPEPDSDEGDNEGELEGEEKDVRVTGATPRIFRGPTSADLNPAFYG